MLGDDSARADYSRSLFDELRAVRQAGLTRINEVSVPHLLEAGQMLGGDADLPAGETIRRLILRAIETLDGGVGSVTLAQVFGVAPGTRMWSATDRRRAAARAQSVSVERFRRGYEPQLIQLVADQIITMLRAKHKVNAPELSSSKPVLGDDTPLAAALGAANAKADWREVRGAYQQCLALATDADINEVPERVLGGLGRALEGLVATYAGDEEQFLSHAVATMLDVDGADRITYARLDSLYEDERFRRLAASGGPSGVAMRPAPVETCVETIRRIRDLRSFRDAVSAVASSGVVGGSSSYSRFHRIRGAHGDVTGSDLDIVVVVDGGRDVGAIVDLVSAMPAVDRASAAALVSRSRTFLESDLDDGRTVFSHKLTLWSDELDPVMAWRPAGSGAYVLDLRILSLPVLSWLLLADAARIDREVTGNWRAVRDYCDRRSYSEDDQRSFSGRNMRFTVTVEDVDGGALRTTRAYFIDDRDRFYPGTLQNLVLPLVDCRWDGLGIGPVLGAFREKINRRIGHERQASPHEVLLPSLAHARSPSFTASVLQRLGEG